MATPITPSPTAEPKEKKRSSVRHTRAIQRDRSKRPTSAPPAEAVVARLTEIVHPATLAQVRYFHGLGLPARLLSLPVMVGLVLGLLWRQLGSVSEWVRVVQTEVVLWVPPLRDLTQQALAQRLRTLPAELFARVLRGVLPVLHTRWRDRRRPLPPVVAWVQARYAAVLIADGSTLDGLVRKIGLLQDTAKAPLAGRMLTLLDLSTRLPWRVWYEADPKAHDTRFWDRLLAAVPTGALVVFDLGFTDCARFAGLTARNVTWLTRAKSNLVYEVAQVRVHTSAVRDRIVWIGAGATRQRVRLIEVQAHGTVHRYDQRTRPHPLAHRPGCRAVPPTLAGGGCLRDHPAAVGLGLFLQRGAKRRRDATVGHLAAVRRPGRSDRRRGRGLGLPGRRPVLGNGRSQSVFPHPGHPAGSDH